MFVLMLPAMLFYMAFSVFRSVAEFFDWTFVPGLLGLYLGVVLYIFGQPDPTVPWETIFQALAGITIAGIAMPFALMIAGALILGLGAVRRLKLKIAKR
jgi:hypothetical protein